MKAGEMGIFGLSPFPFLFFFSFFFFFFLFLFIVYFIFGFLLLFTSIFGLLTLPQIIHYFNNGNSVVLFLGSMGLS